MMFSDHIVILSLFYLIIKDQKLGINLLMLIYNFLIQYNFFLDLIINITLK